MDIFFIESSVQINFLLLHLDFHELDVGMPQSLELLLQFLFFSRYAIHMSVGLLLLLTKLFPSLTQERKLIKKHSIKLQQCFVYLLDISCGEMLSYNYKFNVYNSYLIMKNFRNYKSKIVKFKRDSQKIQQSNLLQLIREFQSIKMNVGQNSSQEQLVQQQDIEQTLVNELREDCLFPQKNHKWEKIFLQNEKYLEKEGSTMESLCQEQQGQNETHHKEKQNKLLQNNKYHKSTEQNKGKNSQIKNKVKTKGNSLPKIQKTQSYQDKRSQIYKQQQFMKLNYKKSERILRNSSQFDETSQQFLDLNCPNENQKKQQSNLDWIKDLTIKQEDEQKIEMLFRQQYKGLFSSTISDIQFKQGTNTTSSFQNQLQSSQGLLGKPTNANISKFTSILNVLNKKNKNSSQQLRKVDSSIVPNKKRKQRIIILNKKEQNQPVEKAKSCQKQILNKNAGTQQQKGKKNKK